MYCSSASKTTISLPRLEKYVAKLLKDKSVPDNNPHKIVAKHYLALVRQKLKTQQLEPECWRKRRFDQNDCCTKHILLETERIKLSNEFQSLQSQVMVSPASASAGTPLWWWQVGFECISDVVITESADIEGDSYIHSTISMARMDEAFEQASHGGHNHKRTLYQEFLMYKWERQVLLADPTNFSPSYDHDEWLERMILVGSIIAKSGYNTNGDLWRNEPVLSAKWWRWLSFDWFDSVRVINDFK